LPADCQTEYII